MVDDDDAIPGRMNVELECVSSELDRPEKGWDRILW